MAKHQEEGGGGHGAKWIVTYSDMITLLMTLFIVIVTFGSKDQDKHSKKLDSIVGGQGGTGAAGSGKGVAKDSVMVRISPLNRMVYKGSSAPPIYSDPYPEPASAALKALDEQPVGKLSDNFAFRVPADFLFDQAGKLSPSGMTLLRSVSNAVRNLPFDMQVRVASKSRVPSAAKVVQYLFANTGIFPARIGVAVCPPEDGVGEDDVLLVLTRNR